VIADQITRAAKLPSSKRHTFPQMIHFAFTPIPFRFPVRVVIGSKAKRNAIWPVQKKAPGDEVIQL
jgi:hypothetical protein